MNNSVNNEIDNKLDEKKEKKMNVYLDLFLSFFKIGLFTFGGGYAMINLLQNEFVLKKKWITDIEFMDMLAIGESTPGPIAINSSTYIGFKVGKFFGALIATFGVVLPSFLIILTISIFFNRFLEYRLVASAFKGIQACVIFLILQAGIRLFIKLKKDFLNILILSLTILLMLLFSLFAISFSSVFLILISGTIGVFLYLIKNLIDKKKKRQQEVEEDV